MGCAGKKHLFYKLSPILYILPYTPFYAIVLPEVEYTQYIKHIQQVEYATIKTVMKDD